MRIVRYERNGEHFGELRGDLIHPLRGEIGTLEAVGEPPIPLASVRLLTPSAPTKIVAVGPNYKAHLATYPKPPRPYLWLKPSSTLLPHGGTIELPVDPPMVCHESELAVVIGKEAHNVTLENAPAHIFGYTCINDVTAGTLTDMPSYMESQYFVDGKIYDTFGVFGPHIETDIDASDLRIQCRVNGETRQDHRTSDMIWTPAELLSIISHVLTLYPGDVIGTGSPPGPGPLVPGDVVEVEVEGIGILHNPVAARV